MSKIAYEGKNFTAEGLDVVATAEAICEQYAAQGYSLTLRQLYYRFIATNAFPDSRWFYRVPGTEREIRDKFHDNEHSTKNCQRNYKWLGGLITDARMAGLIDWDHLTDRTRNSAGGDHGWSSPASILDGAARGYRIYHWTDQPQHVEVWVEKEALADVISRPCLRWDVAYTACKGYMSASEMHDSAKRLRRHERNGQKTSIIHLGDHDPSGLDMTRDIQDRLATFGSTVNVDRIALNMDQVEELNPPPSPAKITDSRAEEYIGLYGEDSWELDALEPATLDTLVEDAILSRLDRDLWDARLAREEEERRELTALADNWDLVRTFLVDENLVDDEDLSRDDEDGDE